ncbi:hypothetical protein ACOSQ2_026679 [Xanthoceras sorbifolium]
MLLPLQLKGINGNFRMLEGDQRQYIQRRSDARPVDKGKAKIAGDIQDSQRLCCKNIGSDQGDLHGSVNVGNKLNQSATTTKNKGWKRLARMAQDKEGKAKWKEQQKESGLWGGK